MRDVCVCCIGVIAPPNHPGGIALILGNNKDLSENQSGNMKLIIQNGGHN